MPPKIKEPYITMYEKPTYKELENRIRELELAESKSKWPEEQWMKSHDLLSNLARLVPGVIYQYRLYPDGRSAFPYASPGMTDIYEFTPDEVKEDATPVYGRLHPEDYDHVVNAIQESARTLQTFYCEFRVLLPRQGLRWRWSQAHPERMTDGSILWHGIISDITDRKQAQEAIAQSHNLMRYVIEHDNSAVAVLDRDLRYIYVSRRYLKDYRIKEKNLIGKYHYDIFPDLPQKWLDVHQKALAGETSGSDREPFHRMDGTIEWTRWECRPWYETDRSIGGIILYTEVITGYVQNEEKLRIAHEKLLMILDSIDAAIYVSDLNTHEILFMNKKKIEDFGRDMTGETCFKAFRKNPEPCEFCTNKRLIDGNGNPTGVCIRQDNNPVLGKIYINHDRAVEWTDGRMVRLQIATDITEFRRMEEQIGRAHV